MNTVAVRPRHPRIRAVAQWAVLGAFLALFAGLGMALAHASGPDDAVAGVHAVHEVALVVAPASGDNLHDGTCANCGDPHDGAALMCLVTIATVALMASVATHRPFQVMKWRSRTVRIRQRVESCLAPVNLDALGICRT